MKQIVYHFFLIASRFVAWLNRAEHLYKARYAYFHELAEHYVAKWHMLKKSISIMLAEGEHEQLICTKSSPEQKELKNFLLIEKPRIGKGLNPPKIFLGWFFPAVTN